MATHDPMMATVAGRYAAALFDLANEQSQLREVERDVLSLQTMLNESEDLRRLVRSPVLSADDQGRAIAAVAAKASLGALTINFLKLVARNRRLFAIQDMIKNFRLLAARHRGEVTADVTSAHPLTDAQMTALKDELRASVGGKDVQLNSRVDPNLLGGLIVKVGSRMIDSSIRTRLNNLKTAMKGTG
ncbi:MAG TPA: F0F1 ATP synthase subunit delta [Hyphomicrobiaceae bacterium]